MAFYNGLNQLNNNASFNGWSEGAAGTDCEPCNWYGVTCDANDRVIGLEFIMVGLTGSVVPEVSLLSELQELTLPGNSISGTFPSAIWNMPKLEVLALSNNNLGGSLPDAGSLPIMKRIFLQNNNLIGALPIFGSCPDLEVVLLNDNPYGDEIGDRGYTPVNLPSLTALDLSSTGLIGFLPEELGQWPVGQLTTFSLADNNLQGCYPASYESLCGETYNFSGNALLPGAGSTPVFEDQFCSDGIPCATDCHPDYEALAALYQSTNGDDWTESTNWLTDCYVCDWFGIICDANDRVWQLRLNSNNLTGTLPPEIGNFPEIMVLILSMNEIGGALPTEFSNLGKVTDIQLGGNEFTGTIPAGLFNNPELDRILLSANNLTGPFPDLSGAPGLRQLSLVNNDLDGPLPEFPNLPELFELSMDGNNIDGPFPPSLNPTQLPALKLISMGFCGITGALPPNVSNWTNLEEFYLNGNAFTGCYPADYDFLCDPDIAYAFTQNPDLPDGGSTDFFTNQFCATGKECDTDCPEFLSINSDADLAQFVAQYPDCTELAGTLTISNGEGMISSTEGLTQLISAGRVELEEIEDATSTGIRNIVTVAGGFVIDGCPGLTNGGFGGGPLALTTVGGRFELDGIPL